jgi:chromosome segregation ATPase
MRRRRRGLLMCFRGSWRRFVFFIIIDIWALYILSHLQLREDKIDLENALEAESENHVNRMTRELSKLRQANAELEARLAGETTKPPGKGKEKADQVSGLHSVKDNNLGGTTSSKNGESSRSRERRDASRKGIVPPDPEPSLLLDALRRENEELRSRLGKIERDYARVKRLNEVYREELIVRRGRVRFFCLMFISLAIING